MEYHKIQSLYKRDEETKRFLLGQYSKPELEYLKNNLWEAQEKVDGTNIRIILNNDNLTYGGKTDNAQIPALLINKLNEIFTLEKLQECFHLKDEENTEVILFGEGYGCFHPHTSILLENGESKYISEIVNKKLNVNILTYNFKQNKIELSPAINYFKYPK